MTIVRTQIRQRIAMLDRPHPRRHIWSGFIASVVIMVASWGVGWLPNSQFSWFAGSTLLNPLRVDTLGVMVCAVALIVGSLSLVRSWLRLGQDLRLPHTRLGDLDDRNAPVVPERVRAVRCRALWQAAALWTLPLLWTFPIFSRDVFSYMAQGRILHSGMNPYETGVSSIPNWFIEGADSIWAESPSPYGPFFLMLAQSIWFITGGTPESAIILFRAISVLGMVLCWVTVFRLAQRFESSEDWALWISVLNPLFLLYLIAGVHNDSLMMGFLLAGFLLVRSTDHQHPRSYHWAKNIAGIVCIGLSVAIKPLTLLALPFLGLLMISSADSPSPSLGRRIKVWMLCVVVAGVVLVFFGWASGLWFGWIPAMFTSGDAAFPYAPFGLMGLGLGWGVEALGYTNNGREVASAFYTFGTGVSVLFTALLALRPRINNPLRATGMVLVVWVLLAPIIQPWYLLWVLPLFTVVRIWRPSISWLLYLLILALVIVGVVDQLSVSQWIPQLHVRILTGSVGVLGMIGLVFIDPATKRSFPFANKTRNAQEYPSA